MSEVGILSAESTSVRRAAPSRPLLLAAIAVAMGIVLDRNALPMEVTLRSWWSAALVLATISLLLRRRGTNRLVIGTTLLALVAVGGGWHHLRWNYITHDHLARFADESRQPVCVEAVAVNRIKWQPPPTNNALRAIPVGPRSELLVQVTRLRDAERWRSVTGQCRLRVAGELTGVTAGDRLQIFALFGRSPPALNPGQYDWAQAERGAGRHCELFCRTPACISVIERAAVAPLTRWVHQAGQRCEQRLARYVGPENGDLALAVLLGERERLDRETVDAFLETGTVHLLVVSGLHVGMLALVIWWVMCGGFVSRRAGVLFTAMLVIAYAAIVGGRPPVIRATVFVVLALSAMLAARRVSMINLLALAALAVLAYNPTELFRSGTQLSFLCVTALSGYGHLVDLHRPLDPLTRLVRQTSPWHDKLRRWIGSRMGHLAVASLIVWVIAAPLVAYHFHIATPIGVVLTPFIWPLIATALVSGLAICAVGWIVPPIAFALGSVCSTALGVTERLVEFAGQAGAAGIYCAGPAPWWLAVFYGGLALTSLAPALRIGWRWQASLAALWIACGFATSGQTTNRDQLHCTFLAMGHGTCVVLELPGDQTILYDAGSLGSPEGASNTVAGFLWSRGIDRIDAVVLSHADVDHYNAMPGLLDRFDVGVVYVSPLMFDPWATAGQLTAPNFLRQTLHEADVPLREIWLNDRLTAADPRIELEILHPPRSGTTGRDNANSILLSVRFAGRTILLPGDLESPGIEAVMAEEPIDVDILLAPHHGSSRSDPPGFAAWCRPDWTVVSGHSFDADQQATASSYRQVGSRVLHTADCGAARFSLGRHGIELTTFCAGSTR